MRPFITIITPVYNAQKYLAEAIASVQSQTFQDYEHLLVIDNKSTDDSLKIATAAAKLDSRIRVISDAQANSAAKNRNIGLDQAKGKYIAFLDADDKWPANKLQDQLSFTQSLNADFTFTAFYRISEDGLRISNACIIPDTISYTDLLKLNVIAIHTALISRDFIGLTRFPDVVHEDFAFWLELMRPKPNNNKHTIAYGLNRPLAYYRSTPNSTAFNKKQAALWRWKILRDFEKIPIPWAIYYFCQYAVRASLLHQKTKI